MRKRLLEDLVCPNSGSGNFQVYAHALDTEDGLLYDVAHPSIRMEHDVKTGFIYSEDAGTVYPIRDYVLSMLADEDAEQAFYVSALHEALAYAPSAYAPLLQQNVERLQAARSDEAGRWNQEEMVYYDRYVRTPEQKARVLQGARTQPLLHIFPERERHLLRHVDWRNVSKLLEIGCGNAVTLSRLAPPSKHAYHYIGTDISLQRLILAKMVIPEGDYVQCSALRLPFQDGTFSAVVSFGVLHHLIDPLHGVEACAAKLSGGGSFVLHEPIERPQLLPEGKGNAVKRLFTTYQHSEHDGQVNVEDVLGFADRHDMAIRNLHFSGSILRTILVRGLKVLDVFYKNRTLWRWTFFLDTLFIKAFCRRPNRLGPKSVFLLLQKGQTNKPVQAAEPHYSQPL